MEDYENDQFSNSIQNGFLNFQKALNEEWYNLSLIKFLFLSRPCIINPNLVPSNLTGSFLSKLEPNKIRDIAQLGRAPALGAGGRRFKSYYPENSLLKNLTTSPG